MSETKPPSARQQVAERIAQFILDNNLCQIFGGDVTQSGDKRYYEVGMSVARVLDGQVRVYNPDYILISGEGPGAYAIGQRLYGSEADALSFLRLRLVEHKEAESEAVPLRQSKRKSR